MESLASCYFRQRRLTDVEVLRREVLAARRRSLGDDHRDTLWAKHNLAFCLGYQGRYEESETLQRETLEARRRVLGEKDPDTLRSLYGLAWVTASGGALKRSPMAAPRLQEPSPLRKLR